MDNLFTKVGCERSSSQLLIVEARAANLSSLAPRLDGFCSITSSSSSALNFSSVLWMGELSSPLLSSVKKERIYFVTWYFINCTKIQ